MELKDVQPEPADERRPHGQGHEDETPAGPWWSFRPMQFALVSGMLTGIGLLSSHAAGLPRTVEIAFYLLAIPIGALHWAKEGYEKLVDEHAIGIEALMAAAAVAAGALGDWDEAALLVFLYASAEAVEEYTFARMRSSIRSLLDLAPKEAQLLRDGKEATVLASALSPGDLFVVRPGEGIPTDGVIREGASALDEAAVTGESVPVDKGPGAAVFAGTVNKTGALVVEVTKCFEENTLSQIIHLVEKAQEQKSGTQLFIERFGRIYSPSVLAVSALIMLVPVLAGLPVQEWITRATVFLVAAAPCALVMSTPVAVAAAIGRGGRSGILIKGGLPLDALGRVQVVATDKTGTLTLGEPAVRDMIPIGAPDATSLLRIAASVERYSEHPLARAILSRASEGGIPLLEAENFSALPGAGAKATIQGKEILVGSPASVAAVGCDLTQYSKQIESLQDEGKTVVAVCEKKSPLGLLALQDQIRPQAVDAVGKLQRLGVKVVMLTGDNARVAASVSRALALDGFSADLKPKDKVRLIEDLGREHGGVAMVGDGINDAPALAAANVGIAMGVAGTDAAIEAADVALMADDLEKVAEAVRLGRRARQISRQNIVFSLLILGLLVPTALAGFFSVAWAVAVHEGSELLAVLNGLRVLEREE